MSSSALDWQEFLDKRDLIGGYLVIKPNDTHFLYMGKVTKIREVAGGRIEVSCVDHERGYAQNQFWETANDCVGVYTFSKKNTRLWVAHRQVVMETDIGRIVLIPLDAPPLVIFSF